MGTVEEGAWNLMKVCMGLRPQESSLIITDKSRYGIGLEILRAAEKISKGNELVNLDDYTKRPSKMLPKEIEERIPHADVTVWAVHSMKGELPMRLRLLELAPKYARHAHMLDIDKKVMSQGMCADYNKVSELTRKIHNIVKRARVIEVLSPSGTNLRAEFSQKIRWVPCHGLYKKRGMWGNAPEGEVFTCPVKVDGTLIIEELGDWFSEIYGVLTPPESKKDNSISVEIKNSRAVVESIRCKNRKLKADFKKYLQTDGNSNRVGEFSFPTNIKVMGMRLIGNLLQDEKARMHLAFGDSYSKATGSKWKSCTHVDCIIKNATAVLQPGNICLMKNSSYKV
jgi:aminopeptidase